MEKNDVGVLFVHGIVGNARIFQFIADELPPEISTVALTLQGHGGNALDFSRASMSQWERQVEEAAAEMRSRCSKVIVVAHSMGCLLTLGQDVRPNVDAYLLLNPPLRIRVRSRLVNNCLKVALGRTQNDEMAQAAQTAYGISRDYNPLHYLGWPARYLELFKKIGETKSLLKQSPLHCPAEVFLSANDEMVSTRSANAFAGQASCRVNILSHSGHYFYAEADRQQILQGLARILSQYTTSRFPKMT